ncbi:MAG TPA: hypothetical protein PK205_12640 [Promineifilum sp.]|nr:hypothetical protein [Promineifilum sp.]HRQ14145.1 hypothetical protein [Promineifilum sp.]
MNVPAMPRWVLLIVVLLLLAAARPFGRLLAQSSTLYGTLEIVWGDPQTGGAAVTHYYLTTDDGRTVRLVLPETMTVDLLALNGRRVIVESRGPTRNGTGSGQPELQVDAIRPADPSPIAPAPLVEGGQPNVTLLCSFPDVAATHKPLSYYQEMYRDTAPGLNHYWQDLSYGLANVAGSAAFGPYAMPNPLAFYMNNGEADLTQLATDCVAAADATVDFPQFEGINMAFNANIGCCAWGGKRTMTLDGVTKTYATIWLPPWASNTISVVMHEMGHGFGLPHSSADYGETYDSPWDVMSKDRANCAMATDPVYGCIGQGTISYHKDLLGWIAPGRKYTHQSGTQTITLEPLGAPGAGGYLMAQIPIDGSDTHFYTIEARAQASYDAKLPGAGVIIHEVITTRQRPARVVDVDLNGNPGDDGAIWTVGETFSGLDHVVVTVDGKTDDAWTVTIANAAPSAWTGAAVGVGAGGDLDDDGAITLRGRGGDIFGAADSFYFAHQAATGSMELVGRITAWDAAGVKSGKAGLMIRGSLDNDAPHFTIHLTGPKNTVKLKWRGAAGEQTATADLPGKIKLPAWLKIIKTGQTFAAFYSAGGQAWTQIAPPVTLPGFPDAFHYGMAVTSNSPDKNAQATFAGVAATPWSTMAVGDGSGGTTTEAGDAVRLWATGGDIYGTADSFLYYALPGQGDLDLRARLDDWDAGGIGSAKAGLMIRGSAAAGAPEFAIHVTGPNNSIKLKVRTTAGGTTQGESGPSQPSLPLWLRLVKTGNLVAAYYSTDGAYYVALGAPRALGGLGADYLYGLAATSNEPGRYVTADFQSARVGPLPIPLAPTATATATPTPTATTTPTSTATATPTTTSTATATASPTATGTPIATGTPTATPTGTRPATATATVSPTATASPTASPTVTRPPNTHYLVFLPSLFVGR